MNPWDQNYAGDDYRYGTRPNAFLVEQAHRLPAAARVLLPGDGEGRNGVWLATRGHAVRSVDGSAVGLDKARRLAARHGVAVDTEVVDLAQWMPAPHSVDAVVLTYVHLPPAIRAAAHRRIATALKPGGVLLLEAFHPRQLAYASGGPRDAAMLYALDTLRADFAGLADEELGWEGEIVLDEGPLHQGPAWVTRWVGCRGRGA